MAGRPVDLHAEAMIELLLLILTGLACLALLAAVPLGYLEARGDERSRRVDR